MSLEVLLAPPAGVENLEITRVNRYISSSLSTDPPVGSPANEWMLLDVYCSQTTFPVQGRLLVYAGRAPIQCRL